MAGLWFKTFFYICHMSNFYLSNRFFYLLGGIIALFAFSYPMPFLFPVAQTVLVLLGALVMAEILWLFAQRPRLHCRREMAEKLSLGDPNPIHLQFENAGTTGFQLEVVDELPAQFQERNFSRHLFLNARSSETVSYDVRPLSRGEYGFGFVNVFVKTQLGLVERRLRLAFPETVGVYPSILQMKRYELKALKHIAHDAGIKKIRRIGHSYEFDQIKNYVEGDDFRAINWKASGRRGSLMTNVYEDEKSQQVWCILDKSRSMRMPFEGLSLMDYSINSILALSNIILKKDDRAGLLSFSDVLGSTVPAEARPAHLRRIMDALYRERERRGEANFELIYQAVRRLISARSLLLFFTNFESAYSLERALPHLRRLAKSHLLVVVFFENTEISDLARQPARDVLDVYRQTTARQFLQDKKEMVALLRQFGIQAVLTRPENLTLNTVNKYLELKSRGLI